MRLHQKHHCRVFASLRLSTLSHPARAIVGLARQRLWGGLAHCGGFGMDVNPLIPSTTPGANSLTGDGATARSPRQSEPNAYQPIRSVVIHRGYGLRRDGRRRVSGVCQRCQCLLIDCLFGHQQSRLTPLRSESFRDCQPRKQMPPRSPAGDHHVHSCNLLSAQPSTANRPVLRPSSATRKILVPDYFRSWVHHRRHAKRRADPVPMG